MMASRRNVLDDHFVLPSSTLVNGEDPGSCILSDRPASKTRKSCWTVPKTGDLCQKLAPSDMFWGILMPDASPADLLNLSEYGFVDVERRKQSV